MGILRLLHGVAAVTIVLTVVVCIPNHVLAGELVGHPTITGCGPIRSANVRVRLCGWDVFIRAISPVDGIRTSVRLWTRDRLQVRTRRIPCRRQIV
jgi:hypothetical protein